MIFRQNSRCAPPEFRRINFANLNKSTIGLQYLLSQHDNLDNVFHPDPKSDTLWYIDPYRSPPPPVKSRVLITARTVRFDVCLEQKIALGWAATGRKSGVKCIYIIHAFARIRTCAGTDFINHQFVKIAELIQISNLDSSFSAVSKYSSDTRKRVTQFGAKHKGSLSPRDNGEIQKNWLLRVFFTVMQTITRGRKLRVSVEVGFEWI